MEEIHSYIEDQRSLEEIKIELMNTSLSMNLKINLKQRMSDEGLLVTIRDSVLFTPGKAEIKSEYLSIAEELADLLVFDPPRHIVVTGHTDNVPMNTAEFASNWELSVMRAVNFLKIMMKNEEIDPLLFSAKGYGEFQPIETMLQRKVEVKIVVLKYLFNHSCFKMAYNYE